MMCQKIKILLIACSFVTGAASCTKSVWEERGICPCSLTLDLGNVNREIDTLHLWMFGDDNEILYRDTISSLQFVRDYEISIKRGMVKYFLWGNIKGATTMTDHLALHTTLTKVENLPADSLYYYSNYLNTDLEDVVDVVRLNKEFITVDFSLKGNIEPAVDISMVLFGNASGFYVDKRLLDGVGKITARPCYRDDSKILFHYRITRQHHLWGITISLVLERDGNSSVLTELPVGKWLAENGYDMEANNLSDIAIELDLSVNFITITVDNWQVTIPADVEI